MQTWIVVTLGIILFLIIFIIVIRKINGREEEGFMNKLNNIKQNMIDCCTGKGRNRI